MFLFRIYKYEIGDAAKTDETAGIWTAKIGDEVEFESPDEGMYKWYVYMVFLYRIYSIKTYVFNLNLYMK